MANLLKDYFYGTNMSEYMEGISGCSLQFHITAKCDQKCKHCYMYESPYYKSQIENPLSLEEIKGLIDEYYEFILKFNSYGMIAVTGGDPILSPYFWDVLQYVHDHENYADRIMISVLGNPFHITEQNAKRMKDLGVNQYQISLDGMRKTHDFLRKPGSFDISMDALKILYDSGIKTLVMFTVSKLNANELIPLYDFLQSQEYIYAFGFDRMIPTGNAQQIKDQIFDANEYRHFLFETLKHEIFRGARLEISKKEQLWRVLLYELGLSDPINTSKKKHFVVGCHCGTGTISVLADGTVFPCRKLEMPAGKYPEKSFKELFVNNDVTKLFLQRNKYKGCATCSANIVCRGCPSMKYAVTGDFYGIDPYCWRCSDENR